jgi:hypothetical protein
MSLAVVEGADAVDGVLGFCRVWIAVVDASTVTALENHFSFLPSFSRGTKEGR